MATQPSTFITPDEYLLRERAALEKSEYYRGEVFAMAGASLAHNAIVGNLFFVLKGALRGGSCQVFSSDLRVLVSETGLYTYPDIVVVCGKPVLADEHSDTLMNPTLIVEVLSESTKDYDRGGKFHQYMRIPSVREYLTVSQTEILVDHSVRHADDSWVLREIRAEHHKVSLVSLGIDLELTDVYENVEL